MFAGVSPPTREEVSSYDVVDSSAYIKVQLNVTHRQSLIVRETGLEGFRREISILSKSNLNLSKLVRICNQSCQT